MKYEVEIMGVSHVATCRDLVEVYVALRDSQCIKKWTIGEALEMADALITDGAYSGRMAEDRRWTYVVRRVD